jgi:ATP-dependent helicase/nuclease subunit A
VSAAALPDAAARARIERDLDTTLVVEAAAGTGKTTQLIRRMIAVLREGRATIEQMVAVTFTEKAAGEMKLRLREQLDASLASATAQERDRLLDALAGLELAQINTIHGFCADLLRERPIEAGIDPLFEVLDEAAADRVLEQAFDGWFERVLADPGEGVRRILRRASFRAERIGPREQLVSACRELCEHRDFEARYDAPVYDRRACIDGLVSGLRALAQFAASVPESRDRLAQALRFFARIVADVDERERTRARDYDGLEAELHLLARPTRYEWEWNGGRGRLADGIERAEVIALRDRVRAELNAFVRYAEADLAAKLQVELREVVTERERLKHKLGALDFVDLLLRTRDLLARDAAVRAELQARYTHLFVDEFQDTDPLQAEIVLLLAADERAGEGRTVPGKLFVVGDPKQSIYRFRRADVSLYERIKAKLCASGAELLHLTTSFRSVPDIQRVVNVAFSRVMRGAADGSQAEYVALQAYRTGSADQPAVIALPVPEPYGPSGRLTKRAVEASYPHAVAAFVDWLLRHSGFRVEEDGDATAIEARHVCLLFRRFQGFGQDMTRGVVRALEARRIPHVLVGGRSLHGREEAIALRAALCAIEWPDDELNVYATLRGPFFAISDEELLCFREQRAEGIERLHPLCAPSPAQAEAHPAVTSALAILGALHRGRNRRPVADTIARLLEATRAHAGVAIWPTGEQALANLLAMMDAARAFEAHGATSFRAFVDWLERQSERGDGSEATIVEEGTDGVRLMTVHKAKGLEFPVVVLCDPTASIAPASASRYTDLERGLWAQRLCGCRPQALLDHEAEVIRHDEAEHVRLAYVAATRARDLLVVPVFGDGAGERPGMGWVDLLAPALYPEPGLRRTPRPAPQCPAFGDDTVLKRPAYAPPPGSGIAPGLHSGFGGATSVVFWDPAALALGAQPVGGVRQQHLLTATERSPRWLEAYEAFRLERARLLERSATATLVARSVTALAAAAPPGAEVAVERTAAPREGRPRGARFGTLVHAVLAHVPLAADERAVTDMATLQQRVLGATDGERVAAVLAVLSALAHPLMQRAAQAAECRREVPLLERLADGTIAHGIADLVFREPGGWVVVDFKTDVEVKATGPYAAQLGRYVDAVRAATAEPVRGLLLAV